MRFLMNKDETQNLAEKIARLLQTETQNADFNSLQSSLEKINQRLDNIESQIAIRNPQSALRTSHSNHSSQEKFTNLEELADEIIGNLQTEKACPYEPTGKPCDHCAMCSSRGF
ncbi:MAG: hypothetical protein ACR2HG_14570 [Pyrinomonadaceae bacterium]